MNHTWCFPPPPLSFNPNPEELVDSESKLRMPDVYSNTVVGEGSKKGDFDDWYPNSYRTTSLNGIAVIPYTWK